MCLRSWRAHDSAVVSVQVISKTSLALDEDLVVTASSDCCCRLWTMQGIYIGSFGQETRWDLNNNNTFQETMNNKVKTEQNTNIEQAEQKAENTLTAESEIFDSVKLKLKKLKLKN